MCTPSKISVDVGLKKANARRLCPPRGASRFRRRARAGRGTPARTLDARHHFAPNAKRSNRGVFVRAAGAFVAVSFSFARVVSASRAEFSADAVVAGDPEGSSAMPRADDVAAPPAAAATGAAKNRLRADAGVERDVR